MPTKKKPSASTPSAKSSKSIDFSLNKFIEDSKKILLEPKKYFSGMKKTGGFAEPILKAVLYGLLASIVSILLAIFTPVELSV